MLLDDLSALDYISDRQYWLQRISYNRWFGLAALSLTVITTLAVNIAPVINALAHHNGRVIQKRIRFLTSGLTAKTNHLYVLPPTLKK